MANTAYKSEKITVTIPYELKTQLNELKKEFNTSMSAIYKEALKSYIEQKEREKWRKAVDIMSKEYQDNLELKDWQTFEEDFYDYKTI